MIRHRFALICLILVTGINSIFANEHDSFIYTDRQSPVKLERPSDQESFTFAIFGDRTGGPQSGLIILEKAVKEINAIGPDMVLTVGDLVQGYNQNREWIAEMREFKAIMNDLIVPWFPVAGNHDIYWRGENRPANEHEDDYETHFGPLWYAFEHKGCWFIILYSDEGNPETGERTFSKPECQTMSTQQTAFLKESLKLAKDAQHVFVFLHHPRWTGGNYGNDWDRIHALLKKAGNVSACFAGHTHTMKYNGSRDNIEYYTLATTGGQVPGDNINPLEGHFHHYNLVTVRGKHFHVATVPVGTVIDPKADRIRQMLLEEASWSIHNDATRTLHYPIKIPTYTGESAILKIGIAHAADDSGDQGIHYELHNKDGQIIQRGFLMSADYEWINCAADPNQELELLIKDEDTSFTAKYPGNGGSLQIELEVIKR